jgi:hypothetical protein
VTAATSVLPFISYKDITFSAHLGFKIKAKARCQPGARQQERRENVKQQHT